MAVRIRRGGGCGRAVGGGVGSESVEQDVDQSTRRLAGGGMSPRDQAGIGLEDHDDVLGCAVGAERAGGLGPIDDVRPVRAKAWSRSAWISGAIETSMVMRSAMPRSWTWSSVAASM